MALWERLNRISRMHAPSNEQETITQIISPILEDLGWDVSNDRVSGEVKPEYPVGGGEGGKADIALMEGDQCVCVVEAKKPGVKLIGAVDQVLRYAFYEGATFCVLTNGLEWRLYLPLRKGRPEEREFAVLKLKENPIEQSENDLKRFLFREAVLSGDAERDADRELKQLQIARELPDIWRRMLSEPDKELVNRIIDRVYDELGLRPLEEQVNEVLARMVSSNRLSSGTEPVPASLSDEDAGGGKKQRRILGVTLFGINKELRSGKDMWIFVVEQVYARHLQGTTDISENEAMLRERRFDFLEKVKQLRARTRPFISGDYQDVSKYRPVEVGNTGIFVETDLTINQFEKLSRRLLRVFGYAESDLTIHEE